MVIEAGLVGVQEVINGYRSVVYWYQRVSIVRGSGVDSLPMELYMRL